MPTCKICKKRIDLSKTGVRVHKCKECGRIVCANHYQASSGVCYECAGLPIAKSRIPFSFIRKPEKDPK